MSRHLVATFILSRLALGTMSCTSHEAHGSTSTSSIDLVPSARPQRSEAERGRAWGGPAARPTEAQSADGGPVADEGGQPYITISAVGDCTLGDPAGAERAPASFHATHGDDMAAPFSNVRALFAHDDLTIANLETTLGTLPARTDLPFAFRGKPEFAEMLRLGSVELVNLANNHAMDCGQKGLPVTRAAVEKAGVSHFGWGVADVRTLRGIEVVNLGYLGGRLEVMDEMVAAVRSHKKDANLVVVSFHWGIEEEHAVNTVQLKLGRAAIDAGADLVLGHHPHVLQGIETYKDRRIVYSLGNFVFGGNGQPGEIESMIYRARFGREGDAPDGKVRMIDDEIVPVAITSVPHQNDFRPVILEGAAKQAVADKVKGYSARIPGAGPVSFPAVK